VPVARRAYPVRVRHAADIGSARLYRPAASATYPGLGPILSRPIKWDLIAQQYDQMVRCAVRCNSAPRNDDEPGAAA